MPYSEGTTPGGISLDGNHMTLLEGEDGDGYRIYLANSNVAAWRKIRPSRQLRATVSYLVAQRGQEMWVVQRELACPLTTNVQHPTWGSDRDRHVRGGIKPDVMDVPECPNFGMVVETKPNATDESCPFITHVENARKRNSCAIVVDNTLKSSIVAATESLAAPTETPTSSIEDEEDAACALQALVRAVLAAPTGVWLFHNLDVRNPFLFWLQVQKTKVNTRKCLQREDKRRDLQP